MLVYRDYYVMVQNLREGGDVKGKQNSEVRKYVCYEPLQRKKELPSAN
jgi:hypothetical protein